MTDSKKTDDSTKALVDGSLTLDRVNSAQQMPADHVVAERDRQPRIEKLKSSPVGEAERIPGDWPQQVHGDSYDFQPSVDAQMDQFVQSQSIRDRNLDERVRRIVREEIERWSAEKIKNERPEIEEGD